MSASVTDLLEQQIEDLAERRAALAKQIAEIDDQLRRHRAALSALGTTRTAHGIPTAYEWAAVVAQSEEPISLRDIAARVGAEGASTPTKQSRVRKALELGLINKVGDGPSTRYIVGPRWNDHQTGNSS